MSKITKRGKVKGKGEKGERGKGEKGKREKITQCIEFQNSQNNYIPPHSQTRYARYPMLYLTLFFGLVHPIHYAMGHFHDIVRGVLALGKA